MPDPTLSHQLHRIYDRLLAHYGPRNWWPAETPWEIMVGAILVQNTTWRNAEKAITNLRRANRLAPDRMRTLRTARLTQLIRPAGFTTSKPKRLKTLLHFLYKEYGGDPLNLRGGDLTTQRAQLLALHGIGPETADAILLYVAQHPIFVIDTYTRRIISRLGFITPNATYDQLQHLFMNNLPPDVELFKEYHALLDTHAKQTCTKRAPRCLQCPLTDLCPKLYI